MGTINVRRIDDEVVSRLKHRAAENNRSLEGEARHILEQAAERMAENMPIRGTAADVIKLAMVTIDQRMQERINAFAKRLGAKLL